MANILDWIASTDGMERACLARKLDFPPALHNVFAFKDANTFQEEQLDMQPVKPT